MATSAEPTQYVHPWQHGMGHPKPTALFGLDVGTPALVAAGTLAGAAPLPYAIDRADVDVPFSAPPSPPPPSMRSPESVGTWEISSVFPSSCVCRRRPCVCRRRASLSGLVASAASLLSSSFAWCVVSSASPVLAPPSLPRGSRERPRPSPPPSPPEGDAAGGTAAPGDAAVVAADTPAPPTHPSSPTVPLAPAPPVAAVAPLAPSPIPFGVFAATAPAAADLSPVSSDSSAVLVGVATPFTTAPAPSIPPATFTTVPAPSVAPAAPSSPSTYIPVAAVIAPPEPSPSASHTAATPVPVAGVAAPGEVGYTDYASTPLPSAPPATLEHALAVITQMQAYVSTFPSILANERDKIRLARADCDTYRTALSSLTTENTSLVEEVDRLADRLSEVEEEFALSARRCSESESLHREEASRRMQAEHELEALRQTPPAGHVFYGGATAGARLEDLADRLVEAQRELDSTRSSLQDLRHQYDDISRQCHEQVLARMTAESALAAADRRYQDLERTRATADRRPRSAPLSGAASAAPLITDAPADAPLPAAPSALSAERQPLQTLLTALLNTPLGSAPAPSAVQRAAPPAPAPFPASVPPLAQASFPPPAASVAPPTRTPVLSDAAAALRDQIARDLGLEAGSPAHHALGQSMRDAFPADGAPGSPARPASPARAVPFSHVQDLAGLRDFGDGDFDVHSLSGRSVAQAQRSVFFTLPADQQLAQLHGSSFIEEVRQVLQAKEDPTACLWRRRVAFTADIVERWAAATHDAHTGREHRGASEAVKTLSNYKFPKGLADAQPSVQAKTWNDTRGPFYMMWCDVLTTGANFQTAVRKFLIVALAPQHGNARVANAVRKLLDDSILRISPPLAIDAFIFRLDSSYADGHYGNDSYDTEWDVLVARQAGVDVYSLSHIVPDVYVRKLNFAITVDQIWESETHTHAVNTKMAAVLLNDLTDADRGEANQTIFITQWESAKRWVATGSGDRGTLSCIYICHHYVSPAEAAAAQLRVNSAALRGPRVRPRAVAPAAAAAAAIPLPMHPPSLHDYYEEDEPRIVEIVAAAPLQPPPPLPGAPSAGKGAGLGKGKGKEGKGGGKGAGKGAQPPLAPPAPHPSTQHRNEPPPTLSTTTAAAANASGPTGIRRCAPPQAGLGKSDGLPAGNWTTQEWADAKIDYARFDALAGTTASVAACKFNPISATPGELGIRTGLRRSGPDRIWPADACAYCHHRPRAPPGTPPEHDWWFGNGDGKHNPARCQPAKRYLCEGGDITVDPQWAPHLRNCVIHHPPPVRGTQ